MKMKNIKSLLMGILPLFTLGACENFLDEKPDQTLVIPQTLDDFQALLDAEPRSMNSSSKMGFLASDEALISNNLLNLMTLEESGAYFWEKDIYPPDNAGVDWAFSYQKIFYANNVLEGLLDYAPKTQEEFLASVTSPDSLIYDPAFVHLALDNGTQLILSDEANKFGGRTGRKLYSAYRWRRRGVFLKSVITFSQYTYEPKVYLEAENKALTAIYRALPEQPKVVIYYR